MFAKRVHREGILRKWLQMCHNEFAFVHPVRVVSTVLIFRFHPIDQKSLDDASLPQNVPGEFDGSRVYGTGFKEFDEGGVQGFFGCIQMCVA